MEILKQAENLKKTIGRVDLIEIANSLGIKVYSTKEIHSPSFIAHDKQNDCYEIFINANEPGTRQRFSIAHEIAHFIRHKDKIKSFGVVGRKNDYSLTIEEEREADVMASQILMPKGCANEFLNKIGITNKIKIDLPIIKKFAKEFEVSNMAALLRIRELGYYVGYIEL